MSRGELQAIAVIIAGGIAWTAFLTGLIAVFRWAGKRRDHGDQLAENSGRWHGRPCGCSVRCSPPGVLTCPRHAARREDILDLLLWADELKDRL